MNALPQVRKKINELRELIDKSLATINPETSDIKADQVMKLAQGFAGTAIQVQNIIGQQVIFNLSICKVIVEQIESQLNNLSVADFVGGSIDDAKRALILDALEKTGWRQKDAAKMLGMSPRAMIYHIDKYGINHPNWRKRR